MSTSAGFSLNNDVPSSKGLKIKKFEDAIVDLEDQVQKDDVQFSLSSKVVTIDFIRNLTLDETIEDEDLFNSLWAFSKGKTYIHLFIFLLILIYYSYPNLTPTLNSI